MMVATISDVLPYGALWYAEPNAVSNAVNYARFYSRSHDAMIRVYDETCNVIGTHQHEGEFKGDFVTRLGKAARAGLNPVTA